MDTAAGRCPRCGSALGPGRGGDVCAPCAFTFALDPAAAGAVPDPDRLGDFDIVREIGRGGMGIVYEAVQRSLDRKVALKVLHPWLGLGRSARERFEREAQAAARLHHAHIVPVYATGEDGECLYYVMERVDGPSVAQAIDGIRRGVFEAPGLFGGARAGTPGWYGAVARAIADVAEALAYAHAQGIVHRDIKPDNLLLARDGRIRLTDFGLARAAEDPGLTATGAWMGSPYYMSPEQVAAGRVRIDHRTDIYSLGVVLYELLTFERPVGGATREQVLAAIVTEDPRPPRRIDPRVPADLESICLKALEKRPEERYADADSFARDLRQFARGGAIVARRAGPWRRAAKWARKHPVATTAAGAAMVLLAVGALAWQLSAARDAEREAHALTAARYALSAGDYRGGLARLRPHATRAGAPVEVRLVYARLLFGAGRGDEAVRQALGVLDLAPDDWASHLVLATAGRYEGRIGQRAWKIAAEDHARAVERASPPVAEGAFLRAILEASDEVALGWLAQALDADPAHAGALEERTRRLMALGSLEDALASAERLIAVRPRSAEGHRLASQVHALAHAGDAAFAAIDRALRLDARDPRTYVDRGWLAYQRGDGRACVADAGRALTLDPALPEALHLRGHCAWLLGDVDRAEADFHAAVELKPDFAEGYAALVMLAQQNTGRTADLAALVERLRAEVASSGDPEMRALALVIEAWARSAVGDHDGAAGLVDAALEHAPRGEIRLWALTSGTTFDRQRPGGNVSACARLDGYVPANLSERLTQLQGLSLHCPPDLLFEAATRAVRAATGADPLFYRAKAALALGRTTVALEDLTRAIALAPGWPDPYEQRARVRLAIGDAAGALEDAERVAALVPGTGASLRAEALGRAGRLDEAVASFQQAIRDNPNDSGARVLCAELLAAAGRVADGIEVLGPEASAGGATGPAPSTARVDGPAPPSGALLRLRAVLEARAGHCATGRARLLESTAGPEGQRRRAEAMASRAFSPVFPVACPEHYDSGLALQLAGEGDAPLYAAARGFALHRRGRQAEAAAELDRALAADPDDPLTLFFAAQVAHDRGRRADALAFYDRALDAAGLAPSTVVRTARDEAAAALGVNPIRP